MDNTSSTTTRDYQESTTLPDIVNMLTMNSVKLKFTRVLRTNLVAPAPVKLKVVGIARIQQGNAQVVNLDTKATNVN